MILFLDIDGVMVPAKGWKRPDLLKDGFPAFSNKAIVALNTLISKYDTTIMLTTSHKSNHSIEEWRKIFENRGINAKEIKSLPSNINNASRGNEIQEWLVLNGWPSSFIILDDDKSLNALPEYLKNYLVLTNPHVGFTEEHLNIVDEILHREEIA